MAADRARPLGDALYAAAGPPSPEPHRIPERGSRSAGPRDRPWQVPAVRRLDARLRQYRGRAGISSTLVEAYVSAAQKISRLAIGVARDADAGRLPDAGGYVAGLSHRGSAVRDARRHARVACVPVRRRVHGHRHADLWRQHVADRLWLRSLREARSDASTASGWSCSTGKAAVGRTPRRAGGQSRRRRVSKRPSRRLDRARRHANAGHVQDDGRPAQAGRHLPRDQLRASARPRQAFRARRRSRRARRPATRSSRTSARSASRALQRRAAERFAEPAKIFVCRRRARPRKQRARARSSRTWRPRPSAVRRRPPKSIR